jgi:hypothetical protein
MGQRFRLKADFEISGFSPEVQVILRALKKYGMILADNGSSWFIQGEPDPRWDDEVLVGELGLVKGSSFEAVDESSLMINPDSGQARQDSAADAEPPTVPTGLAAAVISSSQVTLSWTAATDNVEVAGYRIYRNGLKIAATAGTSYQDQGLAPQTRYSYRISAFDSAGNESAKSVGVTRTTQPLPNTQFALGDRIQLILRTNIFSSPSSSSAVLATRPRGARGTVIGGPWYANTTWWWQVNFDSSTDGWVKEPKLKKTLAGVAAESP